MANEPIILAKPPAEEIVTAKVLESAQRSSLSLALGFGGTSNPSTIWQDMISDSSRAFGYYRELEEKDDDVGGSIEELKLSVLSRERAIVPADDSSQAIEIADFIRGQFDELSNFENILYSLLDAAPMGVSIAELMFDVSSDLVALTGIKDRPQELFTFGQWSEPQIGPLRFLKNGYADAAGGELVPEQKFIVFSYRPRAGNRRGRPLLRAVFWPSWFKRQTVRFWLRFGEKGPGTAVVKYANGASEDEKKQALSAAETIINSVAAAVPDSFSLVEDLLTAARSQDPAVYEKLVTRMEQSVRRRIVGQTLTAMGSDGGKGTQALGNVHEETKEQRSVALAGMLETAINDQVIYPLALWNFGPDAAAKLLPKLKINTETQEDLTARSGIDKTLQDMGVAISESYAREKYSIPEPTKGDNILEPRQQAAPANGVGGGPQPQFSEATKKDLSDVQRLMEQFRAEAVDVFRARAKEIAESAGGGAQ
jgi:phage gp29-like protein